MKNYFSKQNSPRWNVAFCEVGEAILVILDSPVAIVNKTQKIMLLLMNRCLRLFDTFQITYTAWSISLTTLFVEKPHAGS